MKTELTELLEIFLPIAGILINLFGFIFVIRQIKKQALATRGETYTSLCGLSYEILKMIADKPHLYPYFYENKDLDEGKPARKFVSRCSCVVR